MGLRMTARGMVARTPMAMPANGLAILSVCSDAFGQPVARWFEFASAMASSGSTLQMIEPHQMAHVITYDKAAYELHIGQADGKIVIASKRRGLPLEPASLFRLTPDEAKLLAGSLEKMAEDVAKAK
jgi:hypothetical protein